MVEDPLLNSSNVLNLNFQYTKSAATSPYINQIFRGNKHKKNSCVEKTLRFFSLKKQHDNEKNKE